MKQKLKNLYWRLYSRFLRLFLPALVVCCIVGLSCAPAFAVAPPGIANNILSFKTSVHTEGDAAIVQGTIPLDQAQTRQQIITSNIVTFTQTYNKSWFHWDMSMGTIKVGSYLRSEIFPLGYFTDKNSSNLNKTISLSGLPNGTQFSLDARIGGIGGVAEDITPTYPEVYYEVRLLYIDAEGNSLTSVVGDSEYHYDIENGPMIYSAFTIEAPSDAVAFRIQYKNQGRMIKTPSDFVYEDGVHSLTFRYIVNQLEYETGVRDYENNRPLDPQLPSSSDKFDELEDLEHGLIQDAESYMDSYYELMDSTGIRISTLGNAFMVVKFLLQMFLDIPALNTLVSVSLILGLSGTILGIVSNARIKKGE